MLIQVRNGFVEFRYYSMWRWQTIPSLAQQSHMPAFFFFGCLIAGFTWRVSTFADFSYKNKNSHNFQSFGYDFVDLESTCTTHRKVPHLVRQTSNSSNSILNGKHLFYFLLHNWIVNCGIVKSSFNDAHTSLIDRSRVRFTSHFFTVSSVPLVNFSCLTQIFGNGLRKLTTDKSIWIVAQAHKNKTCTPSGVGDACVTRTKLILCKSTKPFKWNVDGIQAFAWINLKLRRVLHFGKGKQ